MSRARGVADARLADLRSPPPDACWGAVLLLCGNLGLAGGWAETRTLLTRLATLTRPGAILVADTVDLTVTTDPVHLAYMRSVQDRGLPTGLVRLRRAK